MRELGVLSVVGGVIAMSTAGVVFAVPASADQQVVNPARCAAQGGLYSTAGTSRSCTVTTSAPTRDAIQFKEGPVTASTSTAAYLQVTTVTDTTTTTTGASTTATSALRVTGIVPGSASCASGTTVAILAHTAALVDCATVGLPDLNSADPIFVVVSP